ncbi:MspA family porin [Nocardia noduli]|uniref:MspA family porin n=1 Tax=Nocardia noduli TaxID=2815722 RepID=UPI001C23BC67|nr:MspA family porin [Nocardia noduli]
MSTLQRAALAFAGAAVACVSSVALPQANAEIIPMPPHEKSFVSPNGIPFAVGNRDEFINRIPPLNMMGTTREALVSSVSYGRIDGEATGTLRVGYHVGCAVNIGSGTFGVTPNVFLDDLDPTTNPFNIVPVATLTLNPGEVGELSMAEKAMVPGKTIYAGIRDYHIRVNSCTGPVTLRQFTYVNVASEEADDSGAVFGDPTWL